VHFLRNATPVTAPIVDCVVLFLVVIHKATAQTIAIHKLVSQHALTQMKPVVQVLHQVDVLADLAHAVHLVNSTLTSDGSKQKR